MSGVKGAFHESRLRCGFASYIEYCLFGEFNVNQLTYFCMLHRIVAIIIE